MIHQNVSYRPHLKMAFVLTYSTITSTKPPRVAKNEHKIHLISARNSISMKIDAFSANRDSKLHQICVLISDTANYQMGSMTGAIKLIQKPFTFMSKVR